MGDTTLGGLVALGGFYLPPPSSRVWVKSRWFSGYFGGCFLPVSATGAENAKSFYFSLKSGKISTKPGGLGGFAALLPLVNRFCPNLGFFLPAGTVLRRKNPHFPAR